MYVYVCMCAYICIYVYIGISSIQTFVTYMKVLYLNTYECMIILIWNVYELFISVKNVWNVCMKS